MNMHILGIDTNVPLTLSSSLATSYIDHSNLLTRLSTTSLRRTTASTLRSTLAILRHLPAARSTRSSLFLALVFADFVVCGGCLEGVGLYDYILALTSSSQITIESISVGALSGKRPQDQIQSITASILTKLTSLPLSFSAVADSCSGLVSLGSKAAFSTAAAASSEPDLLYSFGSGLRESLSCVSLRARIVGDWEKGRLLEAMRGARTLACAPTRVVRRERRRVGRSIVLVCGGLVGG
jgi:hypothetical protein